MNRLVAGAAGVPQRSYELVFEQWMETSRGRRPEMNERHEKQEQAFNTHERFHKFFDRIATAGFFGKISVSLQNGRICDVRIEQNRKLDEL